MADERDAAAGKTAADDISPRAAAEALEIPDEVDPKVAELVMTIRDRFGLRGLRGARWMMDKEIALAEEALAALSAER